MNSFGRLLVSLGRAVRPWLRFPLFPRQGEAGLEIPTRQAGRTDAAPAAAKPHRDSRLHTVGLHRFGTLGCWCREGIRDAASPVQLSLNRAATLLNHVTLTDQGSTLPSAPSYSYQNAVQLIQGTGY